jgi:7-cyano-7-deazaguanine synthase in queuosine biosynthesis
MPDIKVSGVVRPPGVGVAINDRLVSRSFSTAMRARAADLVDIACEAYAADRLVRRRPPGRRRDPYSIAWSRRLEVHVEVRDIGFWSHPSVTEALTGLFQWLTDDRWTFVFRRRMSSPRPSELESCLFATPAPADGAVALFSGGLDALAGAGADLNDRSGRSLVVMGVGTNNRQMHTQARLMKELRRTDHDGRLAATLIVPISLGNAKQFLQEATQRTRGAVFLCLAAAVAEVAGLHRILMYENGIGAMNLPYFEGQLGAQTSRAAHPKTLRLAADLFSHVLDRELTIENPLMLLTKAEACRRIPVRWLPLVPRTVSCDTGFTDRRPGSSLCGECTSCLLRRQAIVAAGLGELEDESSYRRTLTTLCEDPPIQFRAFEGQQRAMALALAQPDPWLALVERFPGVALIRDELERSHARSSGRAAILRLVAAHSVEWLHFQSKGRVHDRQPVAVAEAPQ